MAFEPERENGAGRVNRGAALLVVDDNEANRDLLSRRLVTAGYAVASASSGPEALAALAEGRFDAVLLDVMMPEMDGLEVLRRIRLRFGVTELPVIMASALGESRDVVEALRLGASDYVTKPLDMAVVLARVGTQLALNLAWTPTFFGLKAIGASVVVIVANLLAVLATIVAYRRVRPVAGLLLVPLAGWVAFASALNIAIWSLNR